MFAALSQRRVLRECFIAKGVGSPHAVFLEASRQPRGHTENRDVAVASSQKKFLGDHKRSAVMEGTAAVYDRSQPDAGCKLLGLSIRVTGLRDWRQGF